MFRPIERRIFLRIRKIHTDRMLEEAKTMPGLIVLDAGDEVICDRCNDLVHENPLYVNDYGLYCEKCRIEKSNEVPLPMPIGCGDS